MVPSFRVEEGFKETMTSPQNDCFLEYELANGQRVILAFDHINDLDGCHISLDMYKANLGPVDLEVVLRISGKFGGRLMERH